MAEFIDEKCFDDYEVLTPSGWKDFRGIGKTIEYGVWTLTLYNDYEIKCADNHIVITKAGEKFVKDLTLKDYVETNIGFIKVKNIQQSFIKENMYDLIDVKGSIYYTNNISSHNSTVIATYALWYAMFNGDKTIGIVSNKALSAIDIMSRIKLTYEELPPWLKPGVKEYSKTFITFDNESKIMVSATSPDAFRGRTLNLLVADEFAFVRKNIAEDFWSANYPTISTSQDAKIIIISTPNGMWNLYHKIYTEAEHCENTFVPLKFTWRDVPGRDRNWADEQLKNLGKVKFAQEQLVEFLGSTNTIIDPNVLEILLTGITEPLATDLNGKLLIYEKPTKDNTYVIGCDVAKGTGENYSVIQVLRIDSLNPLKFTQVATYQSNTIDVYSFADVINRISYYYNNAHIMCENNSEGSAIVNRLWWDHENPNLVNSGSKTTDLGVRANKTTKPKAVLLMKKLIEDGDIILKDRETVKQLSSFIDDNGHYKGKDTNDDCVSALYWAIYIVEMNILDKYHINALEEKSKESKDEDIWGILSDAEPIEEDFRWLLTRDNF